MKSIPLQIFLGTVLTVATIWALMYAWQREDARLVQAQAAFHARQIEEGAALFEQACSRCHGTKGQGIPGLCPPLNDRHFFTDRLKEVGWNGSQEDYIISTVSAGRLTSTRPDQYAGGGRPAMPSWSEAYGGPLREDQIRALAAFIMNWREEALARPETPSAPAQTVGSDITQSLPPGDAARGEALATEKGCLGCHTQAAVAPLWAASADTPGIGARATNRIADPAYTGNAQTPEQYLLESILLPNAYVVEGYPSGVMPQTFGEQLSPQDAADLLAFLATLR